jgi:hypothetical protein
MSIDLAMNADLAGIGIPDSKLAREITELVRDTESPLLFHHSSRVYYWGALAGKRRGLNASRLTAQIPLVTSCEATESVNKISKRSGRRSPCTRRPASRSTCTRS